MEYQDEHLKGTHMLVVRPSDTTGLSEEDIQWRIIALMIEDYAKVHPHEIKQLLAENKILNDVQRNQAKSGQDMRLAFRCPPALIRLIEKKFPDIFTEKKNIHKFMRLFPGFRITDTV